MCTDSLTKRDQPANVSTRPTRLIERGDCENAPRCKDQLLLLPSIMVVKPRDAVCNLHCAYCYFPSKERLYPSSGFRMTDELLEEFTQRHIEIQRVPEVNL